MESITHHRNTLEDEDDRTLEFDMFENAMFPLWILVALFATFLLFWFPPQALRFWKWQKNFRYRLLVKKTRKKLSKFGTLILLNKLGGLVAICAKKDFEVSQNRSQEGFVIVPSTFVFGRVQIPSLDYRVTGKSSFLKLGIGFLIQDLLDMDKNKLLSERFVEDCCSGTIINTETMLYVPTYTNKGAPEWSFPLNTKDDFIRTISKQNLIG